MLDNATIKGATGWTAWVSKQTKAVQEEYQYITANASKIFKEGKEFVMKDGKFDPSKLEEALGNEWNSLKSSLAPFTQEKGPLANNMWAIISAVIGAIFSWFAEVPALVMAGITLGSAAIGSMFGDGDKGFMSGLLADKKPTPGPGPGPAQDPALAAEPYVDAIPLPQSLPNLNIGGGRSIGDDNRGVVKPGVPFPSFGPPAV